jgi:hypothetical protein
MLAKCRWPDGRYHVIVPLALCEGAVRHQLRWTFSPSHTAPPERVIMIRLIAFEGVWRGGVALLGRWCPAFWNQVIQA